eukprot:CAMPEP_0181324180 /NCGR_PEP_ID=MMETSP1101-20121128/20210_1 /TAXON_ID=46948 /ORGANISM="Rhodomonas abbreviata, Strain Caron Lab Isolate" /LENGTH=1003 /DNA_ID=CAMNT_0023432315 /DNA_START=70 /DNA_END=3081 /DNA_ORIENTATION=+
MSSDIRKPDADTRSYRLVELDNKLDIILISDPETNIAAAALAVAAGQLQDPPEVQGLAHFCEHMLFLGNEKYPGESDFDSFCASSAGYSNAWTSMDRTVYHFMLAHDKLHDSLDRFSGFFSCPLFQEDLTERELMAIDSENNKNLQEDARREFQLMRSTARENHPLQRFGTGSYKTLFEDPQAAGTNIREHLMHFYKNAYSANIMKLAVLGREDLDTLEKWCREFFSSVPNNNLEPLAGVKPDDNPFHDGWKGFFRVIPVKERRKLVMYWPMESTYPNYRQKPTRLLSHCIGHEGAGSILSLLKRKGWATDLSAGTGTQSTYFALFEISITLTEEGLPNYEEVIRMVYQYVQHCLRAADNAERIRIRAECEQLALLSFRFRSKTREDNYTESLACNLTRYPREEALCGPDLFFEPLDWDRLDAIIDESFSTSNLRVHLIAPEAEQPKLPSTAEWKEERWYGTKHCWEPINAEMAGRWADKATPLQAGLHLPLANPYTPEDSSLCAAVGPASDIVKVIDSDTIQCWHCMDVSFGIPKAAVHMQLTNFVCERSARWAVCLRMMLEVIQEVTNEEAYDAEEAGLVFDISNTSGSSPCNGLRLTFKGYNDKMPKLVKNILELIAKLDFTTPENQAVFDLVKEKTMTDYRNRRFQQPYQHAMNAASFVFEHPFWEREERMAELETVTSQEVLDFKRLYLSELLVEVMVVGNFTAEQTAAFISQAVASVAPKPLSPENKPQLKISKVDAGVTLLQEQLGPDPDALDSAISVQFQLGESDLRQAVLLELLCQVMDKEMYGQLRTQEQLGYIVAAVSNTKWQVGALRCIVQSVHPPQYLETRLEVFLAAFGKKLESELTEEEFAEHIDSLVTKKLEKDRNATKKCERLMIEVCSHEYMFDRREKGAELLRGCKKEDLSAFFNTHIAVASPHRARVSCHVLGRQAVDTMTAAGEAHGLTEDSKASLLTFPANSTPFPIPSDSPDAPPPALPTPTKVSIKDFRASAPLYSAQK